MKLLKFTLLVTLSIIIPLWISGFYASDNRFIIREVKINSNIDFMKEDTLIFVKNSISGKNIFKFDTKLFKNALLEFDKDIKNCEIFVLPFSRVIINIKYRFPVVKLKTENKAIFLDENLNQVKEYKKGMFDYLPYVILETKNHDTLKNLILSLSEINTSVIKEIAFARIFFIKEEGIYGFNPNLKIMIFYGKEIDKDRIMKSFLVQKYIIQKKLSIRFLDARFENILGKE